MNTPQVSILHPPPDLTPAERQLLRALAVGASNKTIARHLGKSEFTVRNQLSHLFKKIKASNRAQATNWWRESTRNSGDAAQ
jgi:two-component system, NarL family, nitrate/nitrite response regulator NarL